MRATRHVLVITSVCAATTLVCANPDHYYSYYKTPIQLELDVTTIAAFAAHGEDQAQLVRRLGALDLDLELEDTIPRRAGSWLLARPRIDGQTEDAVADVVRRLPNAAGIDFASPVFLDDEGHPVVITQDLLVGFDVGVPAAAAEAILRAAGAGTILERDYARMPGVFRLRTDFENGFDVLSTANALAVLPEVRFAEPDVLLTGVAANTIPEDEQFFRCWGVHSTGQNVFEAMPDAWCQQVFGVDCADATPGLPDWDMDVPEAWKTTTGDPSVIAVVFECGIQLDHPDLVAPNSLGIDTTGDGSGGYPVNMCENHGTWVAGTLCGRIDNTVGGVGVAPTCTLASVRFCTGNVEDPCDTSFTMQASDLVDGLTWAQDIGGRVTNHSYRLGTPHATVAEKLSQTRAAGLVHFASAGNTGTTNIGFPANLPSVNAVSMLSYAYPRLNQGSSYGFGEPEPGDATAFCAPGRWIRTTDRTGDDGGQSGWGDPAFDDYMFVTGTSFASPNAAGVATLLLSVDPLLSPSSVEQILAASALDLGAPGFDERYGEGFVNAANALALLQCLNDLPAGPIADCNNNGVDDGCELDLGFEYDANGNLTLDACEALTLEDLPAGSLPDCGIPAGSWGWPVNYTYLFCEDAPAHYTIVATQSFDPPTPGNSIGMNVPAVDHPIFLPYMLDDALEESTTPHVVVAFDIWVAEADVRGGSIFVGGDHGAGGWGSGSDRGPQLDWKNDGRLTAANAGTILDPFPVGMWQSVRLEIDLVADDYDLWWAPSDGPFVQLLSGNTFLGGVELDHIDRFTAAYFVDSGVTGPVHAYLDNVVITACLPDTNLDGAVDVVDLVAVILAWGGDDPAADINDDGMVAVEDLVSVILAWGPCP